MTTIESSPPTSPNGRTEPLTYEDGPLVWIDCEMTGLDHNENVIIEIAVIITDGQLVPVDAGINYIIKTDQDVLDNMNEWCIKQHGMSGLTQACLDSTYTYDFVAEQVVRYVKRWIPRERIGVLAGSSVHADARFLAVGMPQLMEHLHYRIVDVSSIKEVARRWFPKIVDEIEASKNKGQRESAHRALDDIQASIRELESYRKHIFIPPSSDSVKPDHHLDAGQNRAGFSIDSSSQGSLTNDQSTGSLLLSSCVHRILHDSSWFPAIVGLWLVAEAGLCGVIIEKIPYTNIDYLAYTQQAALFLSPYSERLYSNLVGGTGPLVYPALHLYLYSALHRLFPDASQVEVAGFVPTSGNGSYTTLDKSTHETLVDPQLAKVGQGLRPLQWIWAGVFVTTLGLVALISGKARMARSPSIEARDTPRSWFQLLSEMWTGSPSLPLLLILLTQSKRLYSIYVLRLFNDPLAMVILYASIVFFMSRHWKIGSVVFSLALGVKMNIMLFLPGLLVLLFQYQGIVHGAICLLLIALTQVILAIPFLSNATHAKDYWTSAFDLSRAFLFKWSVNWHFLGEQRFSLSAFQSGLLVAQVTTLVLFAWFKWSNNVPGGTLEVLKRGLSSWSQAPVKQGRVDNYHIPLVLFTSNVIGIVFARSLHYQFFSWYAHQIPFLLWSASLPLAPSLVVWGMIAYAWNSFPPSSLASGVLAVGHGVLLALVWSKSYRLDRGKIE